MHNIMIIGATSGIAQAAARLLAKQGARLFLVARNGEALNAVAEDLRTHGAAAVGSRVMDLNDTAGHGDLVQQANDFLDGKMDTALIAHGSLGDQKVGETDWQTAQAEFQTNFLSAASLLTHLANRFEAAGKGCIAVISSVAGDRGRQSNYIYGAGKAAVSVFAEGLRNRLYHKGVHVVTIKPGFVATPMTAHLKQGPLFASPETVAKGILKAIAKRKNVVYLPWFWRYIMLVVKLMPEFIFKKLKM
ncbi:MAG: SDR family oxidoreductase [Acidobacteriota bacterium]|nr:SDR family oxidoreductase [Acidobacteriota bacterium]